MVEYKLVGERERTLSFTLLAVGAVKAVLALAHLSLVAVAPVPAAPRTLGWGDRWEDEG